MYKVKFYGLGGQGVVTAAKILCHSICIYEDKYAKTVPAYGHERRGAPVFSDVIIDDKPVLLSSFVYEPDVVIVFDPHIGDNGIDIEKGVHADTVLVVNCDTYPDIKTQSFQSVYYVDAKQIALSRSGNDIPNIPMLGALAKAGFLQIDSLIRCINETFKGKETKIFVEMVKEAYDKTRKI